MKNSEEKTVWKAHVGQMTTSQLVKHYCCIAIGSGILTVGSSYKCGIILGTITNFFFAFTTFLSLALTALASIATKCPTNPEIFSHSISTKFVIPFTIFNMLPMFIHTITHLQFVQSSLIDTLSRLAHINSQLWAFHDYMIALYAFIIIIFPCLLIRNFINLQPFIKIKWIFIILIGAVVIYYFVFSIIKSSFNPNNQLVLFRTGDEFTSAILNFAVAYMFQPIAAPSIDVLEKGTKKSIIKMFFYTVLTTFIVFTLFGVVEYLTFFDDNMGDLITKYYPNSWPKYTANILLAIMMSFSVVLLINPQRYVIIKTIAPGTNKLSYKIWTYCGLLIFLLAFFLTTAEETIAIILNIILEFTTPINLYLVPSILYLASCMKERSKLWITIAIFNILIGIAVLVPITFKYIQL